MTQVGPSSLIGVQAYSVQLQRRNAAVEADRGAAQDRERQAVSRAREDAVRVDVRSGDTRRLELREFARDQTRDAERSREASASAAQPRRNPTVGDVERRPNPPATAINTNALREAPTANVRQRIVPPGTQVDISV